ncbi:hypothetical protein WR25_21950 isoform B [Diploscapter pachys]|uniref:Chondroitin proteoglycan 4 domain-containing protein n=1 Tax=Diploscapter pachys TaxID=2018661 RepID=A0A2A2K516_9BILA|nr:hypothetical protein WR25_21950 isoform B [Diploscapter pachys]
MWLLRLLLVAVFQFIVAEGQDSCTERCKRIDTRSMGRIGFDEEKRTVLFEKQRPLAQMKRVCWRAYDYLDCMKKCPSTPEHVKFTKLTRNKCKFALRDLDEQLQCITRYHTFIRLRCSSFQKESVQQRRLNVSFTPSEESCRLLNLNLLCLENHIVNYCPRAKKIFTRYNFRDYFLNFVLPEDDLLFDEDDLDACQVAQQPDGIDFTDSIETTTDTTSTYDDYPEADTQFTPFPDLTGGTAMVKILPTDPGDAERARTEERQAFTELLDELITSTELNEFGKSQEPDEDHEDRTEVPVIVGGTNETPNKKEHEDEEIFIDVKSAEKNEDEQLPEHHEDHEDTTAEIPMATDSHATVEMATESYEDLPTKNVLHKTKDTSAEKFEKVKDKSEEKIETQVESTVKTERTPVLTVTEMINDTVVHHSNEGDEIFLDVNDRFNEKVDYAVTDKSSKEVHSREKAPEKAPGPTPKFEVPELIFGSKEKTDEGAGVRVDPIDHKANDEKYKLALNETMAAPETEDLYDGVEEMTDGPYEATDELPTQKGKEYEKYETSPQINIVPIVTRLVNKSKKHLFLRNDESQFAEHDMNLGREVVIESSSPHGMTTSRKKIFSGDHSLEDVPPNFMYSSSRGH